MTPWCVSDAGDLVAVPLPSPAVSRTLGIVTRKNLLLRADILALLSEALKRSVNPGPDPQPSS